MTSSRTSVPILLSYVYDDLFVSEAGGGNIVYILELLGCFSSYLVSSVVAWGLRALHACMFSGLFSRFLTFVGLRLVSSFGLAYLSATCMLYAFRVLFFFNLRWNSAVEKLLLHARIYGCSIYR